MKTLRPFNLTYREAVRLTKKAWKPILEGRFPDKLKLLDSEEFKWLEEFACSCPLCHYSNSCYECPLYVQFGVHCDDDPRWDGEPKKFAEIVMRLDERKPKKSVLSKKR